MCGLILQYPQTGRTSGNCPTLVIPTSWSRSCSTLRRVEPHATQQEAAWTYRVNRLAVPSDGSNLRQLTAQHIDHIDIRPCSTLRRVEPQATYHNRLVSHRLHLLQYPQTGRTSCNILLLPDNTAALRLAVPSDGSNLMQRRRKSCPRSSSCLAVPSDGSNLMQRVLGEQVAESVALAVPSDGSNLRQLMT